MIDDILKADNDDENDKKSEARKKREEKKKRDAETKSRLESLKKQLKADPINLDTDPLHANVEEFPESTQAKYVDYENSKLDHKSFASVQITNIILTYVKSDKLLNSPRLKDLKEHNIRKYSALLLQEQMAESNLIQLQEAIDGGDMSKDMFVLVNQTSKELRDILDKIDKLREYNETYWKDFAENYGMESEEEKIAHEIDGDSEEQSSSLIITTQSNINDIIDEKIRKKEEEEKENKKREDELRLKHKEEEEERIKRQQDKLNEDKEKDDN